MFKVIRQQPSSCECLCSQQPMEESRNKNKKIEEGGRGREMEYSSL